MREGGAGRDAELDSFVERFLVSFAAWDLLVLLHSQPGLQGSAAHLAYRLGRSERDIAEALSVMADGGLVVQERADGEELYGLSLESVPVIERFSTACRDREWRLDLVRMVLSRIGTP